MSAYNWIEFEGQCPACMQVATIKCQTHVASSYDGHDNIRFHDILYHIGGRMNWYSIDDVLYPEWKQGNFRFNEELPLGMEMECCYGNCNLCKSEIFAVVKFKECVISNIEAVGNLTEWPKDYYQ